MSEVNCNREISPSLRIEPPTALITNSMLPLYLANIVRVQVLCNNILHYTSNMILMLYNLTVLNISQRLSYLNAC